MNKHLETAILIRTLQEEAVTANLFMSDLDKFEGEFEDDEVFYKALHSAYVESFNPVQTYHGFHYKNIYIIPLNLDRNLWMVSKGEEVIFKFNIRCMDLSDLADMLDLAQEYETVIVVK